jgi:hypothetical protein
MAIRTISLEKVRFDLKLIRAAMNLEKLNADDFLYFSKYAELSRKWPYFASRRKSFLIWW